MKNNLQTEFFVYGKIHGKARPRVTRSVTYTPASTVAYENLIKESYIVSRGQKPINLFKDRPLLLLVEAFFKVPESISKKDIPFFEKDFVCCTKKPDCDNIEKIVADALNTVAYNDDCQIVNACIDKSWTTDEEYIKVTLTSGNGKSYQDYKGMNRKQKDKLLKEIEQ